MPGRSVLPSQPISLVNWGKERLLDGLLSVLSVLITKEFAEVKAFHTSVGKTGGTWQLLGSRTSARKQSCSVHLGSCAAWLSNSVEEGQWSRRGEVPETGGTTRGGTDRRRQRGCEGRKQRGGGEREGGEHRKQTGGEGMGMGLHWTSPQWHSWGRNHQEWHCWIRCADTEPVQSHFLFSIRKKASELLTEGVLGTLLPLLNSSGTKL